MMGLNNIVIAWFMEGSKHGLTTKTTQYVAKAIYATRDRCLLKARAMSGQRTTKPRRMKETSKEVQVVADLN